jgi:SAM-dependent methyltransferase
MSPDDAIFENIERCRLCGSIRLQTIIALGDSPLADQLITRADLERPQHRAPLTVVFCPNCSLLQLRETVRPDLLFNERYPYHSSVSPSLRSHFEAYANRLIPTLRDGAFVVEAGSNDGCLLKHFAAAGARCLGVDPAQGPASVARHAGIPTERAFFGEALAQEIRQAHGPCDLFLANNVLAHATDLHGFVRGIGRLLADGGTAMIEVPHVVPLIEGLEFDTIYHQHLCYFSLASLDTLFSLHGLALCDAEPFPINGGSLRLTVRRAGEPSRRLLHQMEDERARGAPEPAYYRDFAKRVSALRDRLLDVLASCRAKGPVAGYGAAAKACTL